MFGWAQAKRNQDGAGAPRKSGWFAAFATTVLVTGAVFYLVASAAAERQTRVFDRGAHNDLERIGLEIDYRVNNLAAKTGDGSSRSARTTGSRVVDLKQGERSAGQLTFTGAGAAGPPRQDSDAEACAEDANTDCIDRASEAREADDTGPGSQVCRNSIEAAPGARFFGLCERQVQANRGRVRAFAGVCPPSGGDCSIRFFAGRHGLSLDDLGVRRLAGYAVYDESGALAVQVDGNVAMPARLPVYRLRELASEAQLSGDANGASGENGEGGSDGAAGNPLDGGELADGSVGRDIVIGSERYRAYAMRLDNSQALEVGRSTCGQRECYLVGLSPVRGIWDELTSLDPLTQLIFVAVIAVLIMSIPVLKLATIGGNSTFSPIDVAALAVALPLAIAIATLVLLSTQRWIDIARDADSTAVTAVEEIDERLEGLSSATYRQIRAAFSTDATGADKPTLLYVEQDGRDRRSLYAFNAKGPVPAQVADRRYVDRGIIRDGAWDCSGKQSNCSQFLAREKVLPSRNFDPGATATIFVLPMQLSDDRRGVMLATPTIGGQPVDPPLARAAPGFGYAVIDAATSRVMYHHDPKRELHEVFAKEIDGYRNGWIDQLAKSMPDQCAVSQRDYETRKGRLYYGGKVVHAAALPNCQSGWISIAWWEQSTLQYEATDAALLASGIYLTFFLFGLGLLYVGVRLGLFDLTRLWPVPLEPRAHAGADGVTDHEEPLKRTKGFVLGAFITILISATLFDMVARHDDGGAWSNLVLWLAIFVFLTLQFGFNLWRYTYRLWEWIAARLSKIFPTAQGDSRVFDRHTDYRRWLLVAHLTAVLLVAVLPVFAAHQTAVTHRDYIAQFLDNEARAAFARDLRIAGPADAPDEVERATDATDTAPTAPVIITGTGVDARLPSKIEPMARPEDRGWAGSMTRIVLPRADALLAVVPRERSEAQAEPQPRADRKATIAEPRGKLYWMKVIGLLFVGGVVVGGLVYALSLLQRALFGMQHIAFPRRKDDTDLVSFVTAARKTDTRRFLIIDCTEKQKQGLEDHLERNRQIMHVDLSLQRGDLKQIDPSRLSQQIWFITNVDSVMSDPEIRERGLEILEILSGRPEVEIYLFSEVPPLVRLTGERETLVDRIELLRESDPAAVQMLDTFNREQDRWSRLLGDFQTIYCSAPDAEIGKATSPDAGRGQAGGAIATEPPAPSCPQAELILQERQNIRYQEARRQLEALAEDENVCTWSREQVIVRLQAEMAEYYERQWRICSREEQLALLQIAEGKFLNTADFAALSHLLHRGLVVRNPTFEVMNESFANWLRTTEKGGHFEQYRHAAERSGTWRLLRLPVLVAVVGSVSLLGYLNQENVEFMIALLPALLSGLPVLVSSVLQSKPVVAR